MSDRKELYPGELVTAEDLNGAFDQLENADRALVEDSVTYGIIEGLGVAQHAGTPNLTVDVSLGTAYAPGGERMRVGINTNLNCAVDRDAVSTTVTVNINSRILSVILRPDRVLSDPRIDATSSTVYFQRTESYALEVIQGAEAAIPTAPAIPAGSILVADITRTYGQTQILTADILAGSQIAHRRQDVYVLTGSPLNVRTGKPKTAMQAIVSRYNDHVNSLADPHDASAIDYIGSGSWADAGLGLPAGPIDDALSAVPSTLGATTLTDSGVRKIGAEAHTLGSVTIPAGTLYSWLTALRVAGNIIYNGSGVWADSSSGLAAANLETTIDSLVSTLAATTGAARLGMAAVGNFANGTLQGGFAALASTSSGDDGLLRIGAQAVGNFTGATARAQLTELTATTSSNDGAKRIGGQAVAGSYTAGTVRSQLDEVVSGTQAITGAKTFDNITVSGANKYKVTTRTVTREQEMIFKRNTGTDRVKVLEAVDVSTIENAVQPLNRIPHGATVSDVTFYHDRVDGGALPFVRVQGEVFKVDVTTGTITQLGSTTTDTVATLGAYNAYHSFSVTGLSEVIDRTKYSYYAKLLGETTPNDQTTWWYGTTVTFTVAACEEAQ